MGGAPWAHVPPQGVGGREATESGVSYESRQPTNAGSLQMVLTPPPPPVDEPGAGQLLKTSHPHISVSPLPDHWRINKRLPYKFVVMCNGDNPSELAPGSKVLVTVRRGSQAEADEDAVVGAEAILD